MHQRYAIFPALVLLCAFAGCHKSETIDDEAASMKGYHGRYAGIGIFDAGPLWSKLVGPEPKDTTGATIADDEHVIVVVDSRNGEVRKCGDHSGRCVSLNPWTQLIARSDAAPVQLTKHAADLEHERLAEEKRAESEITGRSHRHH